MCDTVTVYPTRPGGVSFTYELTLDEAKQICIRHALNPVSSRAPNHERLAAVTRILKELYGVESNLAFSWPNVPMQLADDFKDTPDVDLPQWVLALYARMEG